MVERVIVELTYALFQLRPRECKVIFLNETAIPNEVIVIIVSIIEYVIRLDQSG